MKMITEIDNEVDTDSPKRGGKQKKHIPLTSSMTAFMSATKSKDRLDQVLV